MKIPVAVLLCSLVLSCAEIPEISTAATGGMLSMTESAGPGGLTSELNELPKNEYDINQMTEESKTTLDPTEIAKTESISDKNIQSLEESAELSNDPSVGILTTENRKMAVENSRPSTVSDAPKSTEFATVSETEITEESVLNISSTKRSELTATPGFVETDTKTSSTEVDSLPEHLHQRYQRLRDKLRDFKQKYIDEKGRIHGSDMENRLQEILQFYREAKEYLP